MATNAEKAFELFKQAEGKEEGVGQWFQVTQERINAFADVTEDHQFIHVDPEKSAQLSPYKVPIAHGFLTLSMLTHLDSTIEKDMAPFAGILMGVNYGFEKVRFISPVKVGAKIRARSTLSKAELKGNAIQTTRTMTIEIEGESKPAVVADWITRLMYG
jgi:acyl dehydratase